MREFTEDQNFRINGVRRVILSTGPILHQFSNAETATKNYICYGFDMKGLRYEIDLQAMPPGASVNQIAQNQVWWVEKRTSLYRLYLYGGEYDPTTRQINSTSAIQSTLNNVAVSGIPTAGQALVATSTSGATWSTISGGATVSGNYLPISGGTISGNLTVASGLIVNSGSQLYNGIYTTGYLNAQGGGGFQGYLNLFGGLAVISGNATVNNALTTSGLTVQNNAVISGGLNVSGTTTLNSLSVASETDTGNLTVASGLTVSGTSTLNNTLTVNSGIVVNNGGITVGGIGNSVSAFAINSENFVTTNAIITNLTVTGMFFPPQYSSAPGYVKGAIYFDTTLNKLRVGGATGWETITSI